MASGKLGAVHILERERVGGEDRLLRRRVEQQRGSLRLARYRRLNFRQTCPVV
jgi:hypothetical protein